MTPGDRVRNLRLQRHMTQDDLAEAAELDVKQIGKIERNKSKPRQSTLERLARSLQCSVSDLTGEADPKVLPDDESVTFCSLANFPMAFAPAVIVVGDRRERPPKTIGDLLALDGSVSDLAFLPGLELRGDTEIVSDKIFAQRDEKYLRDRFGSRHIISVGSPATNYLSRKVNGTAVFRFHIEEDKLNQLASSEQTVRRAWTQSRRKGLREFLENGVQRRKINEALMTCRGHGYIDPTSEGTYTRGTFLMDNDDWGVVSLAPHPYRDPNDLRRVTVLVAGVHLPATMYGLRLLASRLGKDKPSPADWFRHHPCGGIFRVEFDDNEWEEKLRSLSHRWSTTEYKTHMQLAELFEEMKGTRQNLLSLEAIESVQNFLRQLVSKASEATMNRLRRTPERNGADNAKVNLIAANRDRKTAVH
jgi:transcriptional regulator with XRE-family HTH domain